MLPKTHETPCQSPSVPSSQKKKEQQYKSLLQANLLKLGDTHLTDSPSTMLRYKQERPSLKRLNSQDFQKQESIQPEEYLKHVMQSPQRVLEAPGLRDDFYT